MEFSKNFKQIFPIPGTRRAKHLQENLEAVNVKLTDEEVKKIEEWIKEFVPSGDRYGAVFLDTIDK